MLPGDWGHCLHTMSLTAGLALEATWPFARGCQRGLLQQPGSSPAPGQSSLGLLASNGFSPKTLQVPPGWTLGGTETGGFSLLGVTAGACVGPGAQHALLPTLLSPGPAATTPLSACLSALHPP